MKKMLFVLAIFLLAAFFAGPAAADDTLIISPSPVEDCETCTEVLIEPVSHDMVVKFIMLGKFGDDRMGLFTSFVSALKQSPVSFYMYTVSFSEGEHGNGRMSDSQMFSGSRNPAWTVPSCGFKADEGYAFSGWEIYGDVYQTGDRIVLTEYNTKATARWQMV